MFTYTLIVSLMEEGNNILVNVHMFSMIVFDNGLLFRCIYLILLFWHREFSKRFLTNTHTNIHIIYEYFSWHNNVA